MFTPQIVEALKTHWPALFSLYVVVLLATLYLGLRSHLR
jgi:hypothetical protein